MAQVKFKRDTQINILNTTLYPISDGQLLFATDTGSIYEDVGNNRIPSRTTVTVGGVAQNAIAFTSDPQTQINEKEHKTVLLYDRYSSDPNINWGYPSGIYGGVEITNKDFTPYKYLMAYATHADGDVNFVTIINTINANANYTASSFSITPSNNMHIQGYKLTNTSIMALRVGYYANVVANSFTNWQDRSITGQYYQGYYIYKIEGVLK